MSKRINTAQSGNVSGNHAMNIIENTTTKLANVSQQRRDKMQTGEKTVAIHQQYMQQLPCMNTIERGGEGSVGALAKEFRVIAWNVERCLDVKGSAKLLAKYDPDVILLSEMDNGMARTEQKHTTKKLAKRLGMYYLYGVEFLELDLGGEIERQFCHDTFNKKGFHGNAILSKMPIKKAAMLRFDDEGHWFAGLTVRGEFGQPRVGGRMALLASLPCENGSHITVVSTHLESNGGIAHRDKQMFDLVTAAEAFSGSSSPIIIGGDLNSGNNLAAGLDHRAEDLFETAERHGYHWRANPQGVTTRQSRINTHDLPRKKLDWFAAKHIDSHYGEIIHVLDKAGMPLSDHDAILADWSLGVSSE